MTVRTTGRASELWNDRPFFFINYARPLGSPSRDDSSPIGELVQDLNFEIGVWMPAPEGQRNSQSTAAGLF